MIPPRPYFYKLIFLFTCILLFQILKIFPHGVEMYYSKGIFPIWAVFMRALTGFLPFSIGDILYALIIIWLLIFLVKTFSGDTIIYHLFTELLWKFAWIYLIFNLLWGFNYNRNNIDEKMQLECKNPEKRN